MKLHLTKSLRTALLACVCGALASTTWADTQTISGEKATSSNIAAGTTKIVVQSGANLDLEDGYSFAGDIDITGTGYSGDGAKNGALTIDPGRSASVSGTLTVKGNSEVYAWYQTGSDSQTSSTLTVGAVALESGTLKFNNNDTYANGTLKVIGDITGAGSLDIVQGTADLDGNLNIGGDTTICEGATLIARETATLTFNKSIKNDGKLDMHSSAKIVVTDAAALTQEDVRVDADGNTLTGNGVGATIYTLASGAGSFNASIPSQVATGGDLVGDTISKSEDGHKLLVTGQTYFVQTGSVTYDATVAATDKVVVSSGGRLLFDSDETYNGNVVISGKDGGYNERNELNAGALGVGSAHKVTIDGTVTVQGGDTSIYMWRNDSGDAASLSMKNLVLNSNLIVNETDGDWLKGNLTIAEDVTGSGNLTLTNTSNTAVRGDINTTGGVAVAADASLTVAGVLSSKSLSVTNGADATVGSLATTAGATVSGAGSTLIFADASTTATGALTIADGATLDLSNVTTLTVDSLNLASGTTVVLGDYVTNGAIMFTGSLTVGDDVIFDLSSWCKNTAEDAGELKVFEAWKNLFTYTGSEQSVLDSMEALDGIRVTIKLANDYSTQFGTLRYDATTKSMQLVPEPTTATLSLLALAGLAARRRRK